MSNGLIHLYHGDGKGKTTAAMGLAVRALGCGRRVVIVQFLKGGATGELEPLQTLGATFYRGKAGQKFVFQMNEEEKAATRALQTENLRTGGPFDSGRSLRRLESEHGGPRVAAKCRTAQACRAGTGNDRPRPGPLDAGCRRLHY